MRRTLISSVIALALAGTTAFAAQSTPAKKPAAKPAAAAPSDTGTMKTAVKTKHKKKHRKAKAKTASSDTGATMTKKPAPKKGNANK
jgi:hypothetical protein